MEKLELKHLAPYLPYELKFITESDKHQGTWEMIGLRANNDHPNEPTILSYRQDYGNTINIWSRTVKPLLYPLSRLTRDLFWELTDQYPKTSFGFWYAKDKDGWYLHKEGYSSTQYRQMNNIPLYMFEFLTKNHFDVFGLIEKGLAIEKQIEK